MVNVKGKWTLITGAARGIGYLAAQFMAKQGSNLILQSRNIAHTEKILSEVKSLGVEAFAVEAELGCEESVRKMLSAIDFCTFFKIKSGTESFRLLPSLLGMNTL